MTKKIIGLCFLLSACQKLDEQVVTPQEISKVSIDTTVYEDTTSYEGQVVEIEDEAQFVGSEDMVRITHCYEHFDSVYQENEKKMLAKNKRDSIRN